MLFPLGSPRPLLAFNIDDGLYFIEIVKHLFRKWPPTCASTMEEGWRFMALGPHDLISPKIATMMADGLDSDHVNGPIIDTGIKN